MPENLLEYTDLAELIIEYCQGQGLQLAKPVETAYGGYWIPTLTFWKNLRRVHIVINLSFPPKPPFPNATADEWAVELAERTIPDDCPQSTYCCTVKTPAEIGEIVFGYLGLDLEITDLPKFDWEVLAGGGIEPHIPHPPYLNPANFLLWAGQKTETNLGNGVQSGWKQKLSAWLKS